MKSAVSVALATTLLACRASTPTDAPPTAASVAVPVADAAPAPPAAPEVPEVPAAQGPMRATVLSLQHQPFTTLVAPRTVWIATLSDLFAFEGTVEHASKVGVRVPFHGRLSANPAGTTLYRFDGKELAALDARGNETSTRVTLGEGIMALSFSRSRRFIFVSTRERLGSSVIHQAALRTEDLQPIVTVAGTGRFSTSDDDAFLENGGQVFEARTGQPARDVPPGTRFPSKDENGSAPTSRTSPLDNLLLPFMRQKYGGTKDFPGNDGAGKGYPDLTLRDGELVVDGDGGVVRFSIAPRGTALLPSTYEWPWPPYGRVLGEMGGRIIVGNGNTDFALLDARTHEEVEHLLVSQHGYLHVRRDGTWEATGDGEALAPKLLCTDGHRVEPAASCKVQNSHN